MTSNDHKIFKAIYLLLDKYHRLYGLEIYLFSGGHGPGYCGFQIAASPCYGEFGDQLNYSKTGVSDGPYGALVTYVTGTAGIPAWANRGQQVELKGWQQWRTQTLVAWFEANMGFKALLGDHEEMIRRWRLVYTVEQSEKYLLMVNLAGLLARHLDEFPRLPSQCLSGYESDSLALLNEQLRRLGISSEHEGVMGVPGIMVARNGRAIAGQQDADFWEWYVSGLSAPEIVERLVRLRGTDDR